jgi:hypothetical protein
MFIQIEHIIKIEKLFKFYFSHINLEKTYQFAVNQIELIKFQQTERCLKQSVCIFYIIFIIIIIIMPNFYLL